MGYTIVSVKDGRIHHVHHETKRSPLCWYCCHAYEGDPLPFPLSYDERTNLFKVCGSFCSWACVHAYGRDRGRTHTGSLSRGMDTFLLYRRTTKSKAPPPIAPPRQMLKAFGGQLSIDEFRNESSSYTYSSIPENCVVSPSVLLKFEAAVPTRSAANRFLSVTTREDTLRLSLKDGAEPPRGKKAKTLLETALGL